MTTLIIGLGKIGLSVANALCVKGLTNNVNGTDDAQSVIGLSRRPKSANPALADLHPAITHVACELNTLSATDFDDTTLANIQKICIIVAPSRHSTQPNTNNHTANEQITSNTKTQAPSKTSENSTNGTASKSDEGDLLLREAITKRYTDCYLTACQAVVRLSQSLPHLKRVVFISSTSVYAQNAGEIIDIHTPITPPHTPSAQVLWQSERLLQAHFGDKCTIIRPSGIYGTTRLMMLQKAKSIHTHTPTHHWTNRIFDTDLINIIVQILSLSDPSPLYLATDTTPALLDDVLAFLANAQGITPPIKPNHPLPPTGKRLISNIPQQWLTYPTWQSGYAKILQSLEPAGKS